MTAIVGPWRRRVAIGLDPDAREVLSRLGACSPFEQITSASCEPGDVLFVVARLGSGLSGDVLPARRAGALVLGVAWRSPDAAEPLAADRDLATMLAHADAVVEVALGEERDPPSCVAGILRALGDIVPVGPSHEEHAHRLAGVLVEGGPGCAGTAVAAGVGKVARAFRSAFARTMDRDRRRPDALVVIVEGPAELAPEEVAGVVPLARRLAAPTGDVVAARIVDPALRSVRVTVVVLAGDTYVLPPEVPPQPPSHAAVVAVPPPREPAVPVVHIRTAAESGP